MKYKVILSFIIGAFALSNTSASKKSTNKKTNLLLIITDEHNFRTLGCYRNLLPEEQAYMWGKGTVVETPNIDLIAKNGVLFESMYASAPVCSPSRASMFTGEYPHNVNVPTNPKESNDYHLPASTTTIAEVLSAAGYKTGYCGKWHLNGGKSNHWDLNPDHGFQDNESMFEGGHFKKVSYNNGKPFGDGSGNAANTATKENFTTDWLTDRAIEFIDENTDNPFFYVVSIPDPHTPNTVRAPYNTMYTNMKFEYPRTYNQPRKADDPKWRNPDGKTDKLMTDLPQYFGMVKCIDDNVGKLLNKLREKDILENTIVVFTSDHGDLLGEHTRVNKSSPYEASARIPFVMMHGEKTVKGLLPRGMVVKQAANTTDWFETFLSLLKVESPQTAGRDLTPLLKEENQDAWEDVSFVRLGYWRMAVSAQYKLYVDGSNDEPWLIDLDNDPDEYVNLINNPKYLAIAQTMAKQLKRYMKEQKDDSKKIADKLDEVLKR